MNKQNNISPPAGPYIKPLWKKGIYADNNTLTVEINPNTALALQATKERLEKDFDFVEEIRAIKGSSWEDGKFEIIDKEDQLVRLEGVLRTTRTVFIRVFQEEYRSFKGFCSWISISVRRETFLVDLLKLRQEFPKLCKISLEDPNLLKIGLSMQDQIKWLQRDFKIFMIGTFDLKELLSIWSIPLDIQSLSREFLKATTFPNARESNLYKRPNSQQELCYLHLSSAILPLILETLSAKIYDNHTIVEACSLSNQMCLQTFCYNPYGFLDEIRGEYESHFYNESQFRILKKLGKWRLHAAKMRDESMEYILPVKIIRAMMSRGIRSMGDLILLYEELGDKEICRDYDETLLDIINSKSSKINLAEAELQVEQCSSHTELLKLLGWEDSNWKKENSQSMKLFKEIVSVGELQPSIIDDELNQTTNRILSNDELLCLFGYAEHFTKNNVHGLEQQHSRFMECHKKRLEEEASKKLKMEEKVVQFGIPENIQEVYLLANHKKRTMKKEKKKSATSDEKEEQFVVHPEEFLKSIGWA